MSTIKTKNIQHPSATEPALVMNPDGTFNATMDDVVAQSLNGGTFSFRNKLINGNFDIWQRGTNFSAAGHTADRWRGDATVAYTRVFGPTGLTYGMSISAGTTTIQQCIELGLTGKAGEFYNGSTWTLSWYSTTNTFTPTVRFRDSSAPVANDVPVTVEGAIAVATVGSWTRYKAEVTIDQDPAASNTCLAVSLTTSGASSISGVQFEKGGITELERRPIGTELALCQRYYQYIPGGQAATGLDMGAARNTAITRYHHTYANQIICSMYDYDLKVTMRASPSIVVVNPYRHQSGVDGNVAGNWSSAQPYLASRLGGDRIVLMYSTTAQDYSLDFYQIQLDAEF